MALICYSVNPHPGPLITPVSVLKEWRSFLAEITVHLHSPNPHLHLKDHNLRFITLFISLCRWGASATPPVVEHLPGAAGALVRHIETRDGQVWEHDHGIRCQGPQARPELCTGSECAWLYGQDSIRRRWYDYARRRRCLRRRKVSQLKQFISQPSTQGLEE